DDLRHAAEVLSEPDPTRISDLRQVEEALVHPVGICVRKPCEMALPKLDHVFSVHADVRGADLLVIPHHDELSRQIGQEQCFRSRLTRLVDDCDVEEVASYADGFRYSIKGHHPGRNRITAFVHVLASVLAMRLYELARPPPYTPHRLRPG